MSETIQEQQRIIDLARTASAISLQSAILPALKSAAAIKQQSSSSGSLSSYLSPDLLKQIFPNCDDNLPDPSHTVCALCKQRHSRSNWGKSCKVTEELARLILQRCKTQIQVGAWICKSAFDCVVFGYNPIQALDLTKTEKLDTPVDAKDVQSSEERLSKNRPTRRVVDQSVPSVAENHGNGSEELKSTLEFSDTEDDEANVLALQSLSKLSTDERGFSGEQTKKQDQQQKKKKAKTVRAPPAKRQRKQTNPINSDTAMDSLELPVLSIDELITQAKAECEELMLSEFDKNMKIQTTVMVKYFEQQITPRLDLLTYAYDKVRSMYCMLASDVSDTVAEQKRIQKKLSDISSGLSAKAVPVRKPLSTGRGAALHAEASVVITQAMEKVESMLSSTKSDDLKKELQSLRETLAQLSC